MRTLNGNIIASFLLISTGLTLVAQESDTALTDDQLLSIGYQKLEKERITAAINHLSEEDFNQGNINDAALLIRNRAAGLGVYKKGSNPNQSPTLRLRGLTSINGSSEPLIIINGVIGATLNNLLTCA